MPSGFIEMHSFFYGKKAGISLLYYNIDKKKRKIIVHRNYYKKKQKDRLCLFEGEEEKDTKKLYLIVRDYICDP